MLQRARDPQSREGKKGRGLSKAGGGGTPTLKSSSAQDSGKNARRSLTNGMLKLLGSASMEICTKTSPDGKNSVSLGASSTQPHWKPSLRRRASSSAGDNGAGRGMTRTPPDSRMAPDTVV